MIPKHFLSSNGSKIRVKILSENTNLNTTDGIESNKMMERRFLPTLCFSNFVNFFFFSWETWFVVHVVFCLKLCYLNSKMALIKYEFHNTTSVCLKIRMTEYIVYECFHRYVKSKLYYQIVTVCFLRKKLMPTVPNLESNNYCTQSAG